MYVCIYVNFNLRSLARDSNSAGELEGTRTVGDHCQRFAYVLLDIDIRHFRSREEFSSAELHLSNTEYCPSVKVNIQIQGLFYS